MRRKIETGKTEKPNCVKVEIGGFIYNESNRNSKKDR